MEVCDGYEPTVLVVFATGGHQLFHLHYNQFVLGAIAIYIRPLGADVWQDLMSNIKII